MPLRLKWERSGRPQDYIALDDAEQKVCRVYFAPGHNFRHAEWHWTCNGSYRGRNGSTSGYADTKNEAARLAEEAWFELVERADRDLGPG